MNDTLWVHEAFTSVAIQIRHFHKSERRGVFKIRVIWWNIGECHAPWCMNIRQNLEIPIEKWRKEWKIYKWNGVEK